MTTDHPSEATTPTHRPRRLATYAAVAMAGVALGGVGTWLLSGRGGDGHDHAAEAARTRYQCPMHPTVVQDHPGDCPICGMKLVKMDAGAGGGAGQTTVTEAKPQYQCPMHPTVVQDHPGDCPICGMKLVKMDAAAKEPSPPASSATGQVLYQCPMHPTVQQHHPGDCPTCGMKLEKVDSSGAFEVPPGERKIVFYRSPMDPRQTSHTPRKDDMGMDYLPVYLDELQGSGPVAGLVTVKIDPARQQLIGLVTAQAAPGAIGGALRTTGRVAVDETRIHRVNVKFGGFVERVQADFIGQRVQQGEPLFSIYSPELLAAQQDLLLALRTQKDLASARGLAADGDDLAASARRKLQLWDVPAATVARIEQTGQAERTITVLSPTSGVVVKKEVVPGMRIEAGGMPYEIWDLTSVWVLADVYETDLQHVKVGAPATLTFKALPGREYQGRIAFVDPVLDPRTRTAKVRVTLANPGAALKPEMFGEVVLRTAPRQALRIPADAVIDSGTRSVVFVALGDGKFQPRVVRLGASDGDFVEVQDGLAAGDTVVTRANFLVDSESRLKASLQALSGGQSP
jgi:Cu(I)/Ag(I) efflux system membrane fusion protein